MKTLLSISSICLICLPLFSQGVPNHKSTVNNTFEPDGMVFVPSGSYTSTSSFAGNKGSITISLDGFWISNEITNQEFRLFLKYAESHPDDSLHWNEYYKIYSTLEDGITKLADTDVRKEAVVYKDILDCILDPDKRTPLPGKNLYDLYDSHPKFNNYPVVGVTYEGARLYCLWKTVMANASRRAAGLEDIHQFRIPLEVEWEYAASLAHEGNGEDFLVEVDKGKENDLGIYHLNGNVAEWTRQFDPSEKTNLVVIKGQSFKRTGGTNTRTLVHPESAQNDVGFRIVQSHD